MRYVFKCGRELKYRKLGEKKIISVVHHFPILPHIPILRTLLMLCVFYESEHHKKIIFMMRIQTEFPGPVLNHLGHKMSGPQYLFLRYKCLISYIRRRDTIRDIRRVPTSL